MTEVALNVSLILISLSAFFLLIGTPISISLGIGATTAIFVVLSHDKVAVTAAQRAFTGMNSFSLLAIPFFVLAGNIMNNGGIARRLVNAARAIISGVPGDLAQANILGNMLFGSISGSGVAAAAAIGGVMGPLEEEEGYDKEYIAAVNIASAPSGMLIPPSNTFIVYSLASGGTSIAALFMAGYLPGILWGLGCMVLAGLMAKKKGYISTKMEMGRIKAVVDAIPALLLILIIVGGILGGIFTPTEASCIAVVYSLVLSIIYKSITFKSVYQILLDSVKTTGMIIFMIGMSAILSWIMSFTKIPTMMAAGILNVSDNKILIMLLMNLIMLVMGCVMDPTPAILIFAPIFLPIAAELGYSPVHFGVIMVFNFCIGTITPPVGPILFTGCKVGDVSIEGVIKTLLPFFLVEFVLLIAITFIPIISMLLPMTLKLV